MAMTTAQDEALSRAYNILSEHFEASVIVVQYETNDKTDGYMATFHGGWANARGLLLVGQDVIRNQRPLTFADDTTKELEDPEDDNT